MSKKIFATVLIVLLSWTLKSQSDEIKRLVKQGEVRIIKEKCYLPNDNDFKEKQRQQNAKPVITEQQQQQFRLNNPPQPLTSTCNNIDFEDGTFANWIGYEGYNEGTNNPLTPAVGPLSPPPTNLNNAETSCKYFAIIANGSTDPNMNIVLTSPLGGNCARMGGENRNFSDDDAAPTCGGNGGGTFTYTVPTQCEADYFTSTTNPHTVINIGDQLGLGGSAGEVLETTFTVTPQNSAFQYAYLFAYTDNGKHDTTQQPYFKVRVLDKNGAEISCLNYFQQGLGNSCGTTHAPQGYTNIPAKSLFYTSTWFTSSLNLLPYMGQAVTVIFTVAGCTVGGHYGYAYVDCACAPQQIIIPNTTCVGGSTSLIAPPLGGAIYNWTTPDGSIVSGATTNTVVVNQSGTYSVTITPTKTGINAAGNVVTQTLTSCAYELDTTIALYPNPTLTVNSATTCAGNPVVLNATSTGSAGTLAYTWSPLTNLSNMQDSTVTATVNATTSYVVTGTSVHGCTATATSTITASGAPPPTFSAPPVCLGAPTVISNTTGGAGTFDWDFGDGPPIVTNQNSPTHTYATTGTFVVTSTVTLAGCVGTSTANVIVNPMPTATIGAAPVCVGTATTFTSTITNGSTYTWDYGDPVGSSAAGSATPSHTYASANTYAVTLTVTAAAPTSCTVTATTSVIVSLVPTASFSVAPVCQGTASHFDATASTPTVGANYNWSFGGSAPNTDVVTAQTDDHTYTASGSFPVTLLITVGSCSATATGTAVVNPFPTLGFTADHPCEGTAMNITNTTANQAAISNWSWDFGDGSTPNTSVTPAPYTYTAPAGFSAANCYSVVLTATATTGCTGSHDTIVYIHPNPFAYFNAWEACIGDPSEFVDSSFMQVNVPCLSDQIISWNYDFGDGTITPYTSATLPDTIKHTYALCGPYNITATVTTNNGCTFTNTLVGDTVFCTPTVVGPIDFTVCPGAPTPVQTFTTICANGGDPYTQWGQFSFVTGAPPSYIFNFSNTNQDIVPSYSAITPNINCSVIQDTVIGVPISGVGCVGVPTYYIANVWPTPTVTPVASVTVCTNITVPAFNFAGCPGTAAAETFSWTTAGDNVGVATASPGITINSFTGQNATDIVAVGTVSVTPLANGCSGPPTTFSITVDPIPTMTVTSPTPYCPGDPISSSTNGYQVNTDPAGAGVTYTWTSTPNIGMPATGTGFAPNLSYPAPINGTLANIVGIVTYTPSLDGCIGLPVTETVTIKPTPVVDPILSPTYCPNQLTNEIDFTCQPTGQGTPNFNWIMTTSPYNVGSPLTTATQSFVPAFTTSANNASIAQSAMVTVGASLNNCPSTFVSFNIIVNPTPTPKFAFTHSVCEGHSMQFTDLSTPNTGSITVNTWAWDMNNDGGTDATIKNPPYPYPVGSAGTIPVTLNIGTNSVPSCTAQITEPVYVNPNPAPDFSGDILKACPTLTTNFTNLTPALTPTVHTTYSWTFGNGHTSPLQQTYTNASATTPEFYTVTLTAVTDSTCKATQTKPNYIEVYPRPIANFAWGPTDADIDNSTIVFVNEAIGVSTYTPAPLTYGPNGVQYYLGDIYASNPNANYHDGNSYIGDQFSHTYEHYDTATYYVTQWVINKYGCRDTITKPVHIGPNFTFYIPNAFSPNSDGTNDGFKGLGVGIDNTTYNLWVFDRWGLMIFYADDIDKSWDGHMRGNEGKPVLQEDVYVWKVKFHDFTGKLHEYHGTVTLLK